MRELNIPVTTHGRLLVDEDRAAAPSLRLLVGCHGYAQSADEMMEMLGRIPAGEGWTRVSIQALHRFYRGRSEITVASWMTRQDRELLIGDNVAYVDAAIAQVAGARAIERLVFCGFSQGVAMAFRAGLLGAQGGCRAGARRRRAARAAGRCRRDLSACAPRPRHTRRVVHGRQTAGRRSARSGRAALPWRRSRSMAGTSGTWIALGARAAAF